MKTQFVTAPDGRKVEIPAGISREVAEKIVAKVAKNREAARAANRRFLSSPPAAKFEK